MLERTTASGSGIAHEDARQEEITSSGKSGFNNAAVDPIACEGVDPRISVLSGGQDDNPGWPDGEFDNGNNHSLVVRVDFGRSSFLFTGDMEDTALETLVERWSGTRMLDADVWLVGHHGSHNGATPAFMAALTPKVAVVSMGRETVRERWTAWAYGHPRRTAIEMVTKAVSLARPVTTVRVGDRVRTFSNYRLDKAVYATGWDGDVIVTADASGRVRVATSK